VKGGLEYGACFAINSFEFSVKIVGLAQAERLHRGGIGGAITQCTIRRIDRVSAMVLCAGDKAEGAAGRLEDDIAFGTRLVINELVEQDF